MTIADEAKLADAAQGVAAAVTGADTPDAVKVTRPTTGAIWALAGVAAALVALVVFAIAVLAWGSSWPDDAPDALARINWIGWVAVVLALALGVVVFAFASPWVGRVSAEAGPGKFSIGRNDPAG